MEEYTGIRWEPLEGDTAYLVTAPDLILRLPDGAAYTAESPTARLAIRRCGDSLRIEAAARPAAKVETRTLRTATYTETGSESSTKEEAAKASTRRRPYALYALAAIAALAATVYMLYRRKREK